MRSFIKFSIISLIWIPLIFARSTKIQSSDKDEEARVEIINKKATLNRAMDTNKYKTNLLQTLGKKPKSEAVKAAYKSNINSLRDVVSDMDKVLRSPRNNAFQGRKLLQAEEDIPLKNQDKGDDVVDSSKTVQTDPVKMEKEIFNNRARKVPRKKITSGIGELSNLKATRVESEGEIVAVKEGQEAEVDEEGVKPEDIAKVEGEASELMVKLEADYNRKLTKLMNIRREIENKIREGIAGVRELKEDIMNVTVKNKSLNISQTETELEEETETKAEGEEKENEEGEVENEEGGIPTQDNPQENKQLEIQEAPLSDSDSGNFNGSEVNGASPKANSPPTPKEQEIIPLIL